MIDIDIQKDFANNEIESQKSFYVRNNGPVIKDISDLKEELSDLKDEDFRFHINNGNNDFAD